MKYIKDVHSAAQFKEYPYVGTTFQNRNKASHIITKSPGPESRILAEFPPDASSNDLEGFSESLTGMFVTVVCSRVRLVTLE